MRANEWRLLEMCIGDGVAQGMARAYKYSDTPSRDDIEERIYNEILSEVSTYFDFPEQETVPKQECSCCPKEGGQEE